MEAIARRGYHIRGLLVVNRSKGQRGERVQELWINSEIRAVGIPSQYYVRYVNRRNSLSFPIYAQAISPVSLENIFFLWTAIAYLDYLKTRA